MRSRQRDATQIRSDAIKMALSKASSGCLDCVQGYFRLAKENGATEEDLKQAIIREVPEEPNNGAVSRRQLLKLAGMVAAGITLNSIINLENADATTYFYGTDSFTQSCCGIPQNFYIGRFGTGTTSSTYAFNTSAASSAGSLNSYEYWGLVGPGTLTGVNAYAYGYQQGNKASTDWFNNVNANLVGGRTVFADVEAGFGGWSAGNYSNNQQILNGFVDAVQAYTGTTLIPGVYVSPSNWSSYFTNSFRATQAFVLYLTGCKTCSVSCAPCSSCTGTTSQAASIMAGAANNYLGGSRAQIVQYWANPGCSINCGDYNVAIQGTFGPVSGPTYQCTGCGAGSSCV